MQKSTYRLAVGIFTASVVGLQYGLTVAGARDPLVVSIRFFSFFTILCSLLAAAALLLPVVLPRSTFATFLDRPPVRAALAGYMIMVGGVYYVLLVGLSNREGWQLWLEHVLHAVIPPLFVLDWLLFVDKRALDWRLGLRALAFPLAYIGWTLVHGAATDWYPYPFLDAAQLGTARVLVNVAGLVAIYVALVAVLVGIGRRLPAPAG